MTARPRIGSVWARRYPGYPQHDFDFRVTGVFTRDDVTYIEVEELESGLPRRGLLEYMLDYAEPLSTEDLHDVAKGEQTR
ncbi:hypothetical protein ACFV5G_13790 [Streptomyces sp. NPDC059766]|uniref:hypothetical protein n=1 Tax=Streptomyces sp. NPDC059766 TaxID=3346940 RepID=UPI00365AEE3D